MKISTIGWMGVSLAAAGLVACGPNSGGGDGGGPSSCTLPATITSNMELTTACPTWRVTANGTTVAGSGNPTLTIDPGVKIGFDKGGGLSIGTGSGNGTAEPGAIVAVGTAAAPIVFTSNAAIPAAGDWSAVALGDSVLPTSTIAFAKFEYGSGVGSGGKSSTPDGFSYDEPAGALIVYGGTGSAALVLHDLEFSHNQGNGLVYDNYNGGFAPPSGNLKVDDVGVGFEPFVVSANQASTIPLTISGPAGTAVDLILGAGAVNNKVGSIAIVGKSQTWPSLPLPYLVDGSVVGQGAGLAIEGDNLSTATLTIAAPNTLEFRSGGELELDPNGSGQGILVADGTGTTGITLTSFSPNPTPGAWAGISLAAPATGGDALTRSKLVNVTVDWAGGVSYAGFTGAILVDDSGNQNVPGPTITGCTIKDYPSGDCGIVLTQWIVPPAPGYGPPTNTFSGAATNDVCQS